MAFTRLGTILIKTAATVNLTGDETYSDNDTLISYLDSTDNGVKVYLNPTDVNDPSGTGTLQTGGNFITSIMVSEGAVSVKSKRYSVCDGENLVRYYKTGSQFWDSDFPYFSPEVDINSPSCAAVLCDIEKGTLNYTVPSDTDASDGTITVSARSSATGAIEFALQEFEYGNGTAGTRELFANAFGKYKTTYTFSGLTSGSYKVYAKDSSGCGLDFNRLSLDGNLGANAYGVRYVAEFDDVGNTTVTPNSFDSYKVLIKEKGYSDASSEITTMGGA
jgi:hypothetical protein